MELLKKENYNGPQSRIDALGKKLNSSFKTSTDESTDESSDNDNDNNDSDDIKPNFKFEEIQELAKKVFDASFNKHNNDDDKNKEELEKLLKNVKGGKNFLKTSDEKSET